MSKLRVGIIGTGMAFERLHYPAFQRLKNEYDIVALCDNDINKAKNVATTINLNHDNIYGDFNEMLKRDDLDLADIIVPIEQNYSVSEAVAKLGKNFICEKPLASNKEDAQKFLELESKYNVKILIAENFRYNEENTKIKQLIDSNKIGKVAYFIRNNTSFFPSEMTKNSYAAKEWRQHPKYFGGTFLDAAVHDIAGLRFIFGDIKCLQSFGKPQKEDYSPFVSVNTNFLFENGVIGHYTYCSTCVENQKPLIGFRIFGETGEIYLEEKSCGIINVSYNDGTSEQIPYTPSEGFFNELLHFHKALNGGQNISVNPETAFGDVEAIFDIFDSISNKEVIYPSNIGTKNNIIKNIPVENLNSYSKELN